MPHKFVYFYVAVPKMTVSNGNKVENGKSITFEASSSIILSIFLCLEKSMCQ